ncbi:MAG: hypothetical protein JO286_05340 [Solirubrobacterales bacterium]|nr:hypothetical protein [Solirubrobacterales bacterium]MBV9367928.1 hypothetical protein [Solirubrobacterales bacterium]MBV9806586.1 hypothetical protein [Solirubrobacterales bacterium]
MRAVATAYPELAALEASGDVPELIEQVRGAVVADPVAAIADPVVKAWLGRRWTALAVQSAALDPQAVAVARRRARRLTAHEAIARRFILPSLPGAPWRELPPAEGRALSATTVVLCPGLFGALMPMSAFASTAPLLEREYGVRVVVADTHPAASCSANARDILRAVTRGEGFAVDGTELRPGTVAPRDVVLVGYSKGTPDALTMLAEHPEAAARVKAFVSWAGAARGSYLADQLAPLVPDIDVNAFLEGTGGKVLRQLMPVAEFNRITRREDEFDLPGAIRDLRTGVRSQFLDEHRGLLDALGVPFISVAGAVRVGDVPYFQALATLQLARRERINDMQVTQSQTHVPVAASAHLATVRADHWDMAYDAFPRQLRFGSRRLSHPLPRTAMLGATLALLAELGLIE